VLVKNKNIKKIILSLIIFSISFAVFFIFAGNFVLAQDNFGESNLENINLPRANLIKSIIKIINYVLGLLGLIAVVIIIYAGFLWMTAGGNANQVDKAKKWLINGVIGLTIILLSFAITSYVFSVLNKITGNEIYGQPCLPIENCVGCDTFCNSDGLTEYNPAFCHTEYLCGSFNPLPQNIFKISSITTSCDSPPNYTQDVHLCSSVVVTFNHYLNKESVNFALNNNSLKIEDCENDSNCSNPLVVDLNNNWAVTNKSIIFSHSDLFSRNNFYKVNIPKTIKDKTGLDLHPSDACGAGLNIIQGCIDAGTIYYWKFQTGETIDEIPPEIISSYPVLQNSENYPDRNVNLSPVLQVKFSEAILPNTIIKNNIKIRKIIGQVNEDGTGGILGDYLLNNDYSVEINSQGTGFLISDLFFNAFDWYQIEVSEIEDLCNNTMLGTEIWRFQTNDTAPGVRSVYPADGYKNACPDTSVFIIFNTSMYNSETGSCAVLTSGGGFVTSGTGVSDRILQVVNNLPDVDSNPNNYCKIYEFLPETILLNVDQTYTAEVKTDLIINQENEKLEKGWSFKIASADKCVNTPIITRISPNFGPDGTCISIFGRYFGNNIGQASLNENINLVVDSSAWQEKQITTSIPNPSNLDKTENGIKYPIQITTTFQNSDLESNEYNFRLISGAPANGPCLWSLNPSKGCFNDKIIAKGIRFNEQNADSKIVFTTNQEGLVENWSDTQIETKLPNQSLDGNVFVENSIGESNPIDFNISCSSPVECFNDNLMCPSGNNVCDNENNYFCEPSGNICKCKKQNQEDEDDTKDLKIIQSSECNLELDPAILPSPNPKPDSQWTCLNSQISLKFNQRINPTSVNQNSFVVEECVNQTATRCENWQTISGTRSAFESTNNFGGILFSPLSNFSENTFYKITVTTGILSLTDKSLKQNYVWEFATKSLDLGDEGTCPVAKIIVNPSSAILNYQSATQNLIALPFSSEANGCAILNGNFTWSWETSDIEKATINNSTNNENTATAISEGTVEVKAKTQSKQGKSRLDINFGACSSDADCDACFGSICDLEKLMCTPSILNLNPNQGLEKSWTTTQGCYFGNSRGAGFVLFDNQELKDKKYYPCSNSWTDNQIIFAVPENNPNTNNQVKIVDKNKSTSTNFVNFEITNSCGTIIDGSKTPGLCKLNPSVGQENQKIILSGDNFTGNPDDNLGKIFFNDNTLQTTNWKENNWATTTIKDVGVPAGVNSGLVSVEVNSCPSNSLYFSEIGNSCDKDLNDEEALCQVDQKMCGRGLICQESSCTCELPEVVVPDPINIIDASHSPVGSENMCQNLIVSATFDSLVNNSTLNNNTVKLEFVTEPGFDCEGTQTASLNKNFVQKLLAFFKNLIFSSTKAQESMSCPLSGKVKGFKVENNIENCNNENGCTVLRFYPNELFSVNTNFVFTIQGGENGVKSRAGGILGNNYLWNFSTDPDAILCKINSVEIIPSSFTFTENNQEQNFTAVAKAENNIEIAGVPEYNWTWEWSKIDSDEIINITNLNIATTTAIANNINGSATLMATASTTLGIIPHTEHTGYSEITNFLCLNPWSYEDNTNYAHFSTFYCRDKGEEETTEDDLPNLEDPNISLATSQGTLKEYLFLRADDSTDAIGIRIFMNTEHLSPQAWYQEQNFQGSPQSIQVDDYEAIRVGRSIYISAANLADDNNLYTNIYLISYNENASSETVEIFNNLIKNLEFNINNEIGGDTRVCSSTNKYCEKDSDCPANESCNANKTKLIRDTKRITDLGAIKKYLNDYFESSAVEDSEKHYPNLLAGSYQIGISTSKWPSWNQTLGKELGKNLPIDPLNEFYKSCEGGTNTGHGCESDKDCFNKKECEGGVNPDVECDDDDDCPQGQCVVTQKGQCLIPECPLPNFDQESCWDDAEKVFVCPVGSHIYQYNSIENATDFNIYATLEYKGASVNWGGTNYVWNRNNSCKDYNLSK